MSKQKKSLDRLCALPPPADFKWIELVTVLESLGFEMLTGGGSRRKFVHNVTKQLIICHQPHPSPNVDKGCIRDVVEKLKDSELI